MNIGWADAAFIAWASWHCAPGCQLAERWVCLHTAISTLSTRLRHPMLFFLSDHDCNVSLQVPLPVLTPTPSSAPLLQHIMIDLGTGNNNKINWAMNDKQEFIDIVETVYRGARKGRGLVVSPKGLDRGRAVGKRGAAFWAEPAQIFSPLHNLAITRAPDTHTFFSFSQTTLQSTGTDSSSPTPAWAHYLRLCSPVFQTQFCLSYLLPRLFIDIATTFSCTLDIMYSSPHTHTQKWWPYWMLQDDMSQVRGA